MEDLIERLFFPFLILMEMCKIIYSLIGCSVKDIEY